MRVGITIAIVAACKSNHPADDHAAQPPPVAVASVAQTDAKPAPPDANGPSAAQLAAAHSHMKAGWAAEKAKRWPEAVSEFESALAVTPSNSKALAELGFSAMFANELAKAKQADEQVVRLAKEPKLKAAALYNLGLALEKLGDRDGAQNALVQSIDLRPNATVSAELAKLGAVTVDPEACPSDKTPCQCAVAFATGGLPLNSDGAAGACEESKDIKSPVPGWHVYTVDVGFATLDELLDERNHLVTRVGEDDKSMRSSGDTTLAKSELQTVGGHRVVRLEVHDMSFSQTMDEQDNVTDYSTERTLVTICAIGDAKVATQCGLVDAPQSFVETTDMSTLEAEGSGKPTKHEERVRTLAIALADAGTITVKVAKGKPDDFPANVLGSHKLW